jgi:iron complex transport system ATP-binding protein
MKQPQIYLQTYKLAVGYKQRPLIEDVNLEAKASQVIGLLGTNGSGKSTLLRTIMGLLPALSGKLELMGENPAGLSQREKARLVSYVGASESLPSNLHVYELVSFGRYPHSGLMSRQTREDIIKQERAMEQMQVEHLAGRQLGEISDGERQRSMIARALAQDTPLIILDEPAAHLDIQNRYELMRLLRDLAENSNKCILFSSHDLEIALNHTDMLWMINEKRMLSGLPEDLVLNGQIDRLVPSTEITFDPAQAKFVMPVKPRQTVCVKGTGDIYQWTCHALNRYGFDTKCNKSAGMYVIIKENDAKQVWQLEFQGETISCSSIEQLVLTIKKLLL